ncbi:hypothetical protein [Wenyingzhuangia sp. IMCC45574]
MLKFRIIFGGIIIFIIFLLIQDLRFAYFEKKYFYKIVDYISIPFIVFLMVYGIYKNKTKLKKKYITIFKEFITGLLSVSVLYVFIIRVFLMKVLVFTNSFIVIEKNKIDGTITKKIYNKGGYKYPGTYRIHVKSKTKEYSLDSKGYIIEKVFVGENISMTMNKGLLGGLFVKDSEIIDN